MKKVNQGIKKKSSEEMSNLKKNNQNIKIPNGYNSLNIAIPNEIRSLNIIFLFKVINRSFAHLILLLINPFILLE